MLSGPQGHSATGVVQVEENVTPAGIYLLPFRL